MVRMPGLDPGANVPPLNVIVPVPAEPKLTVPDPPTRVELPLTDTAVSLICTTPVPEPSRSNLTVPAVMSGKALSAKIRLRLLREAKATGPPCTQESID